MSLNEIIDRDLNKLSTFFLDSLDYKVNKNNNSFLQLMNLKHWFIADKSRKISFAKDFRLPLEYEDGFKILLNKCKSGTGGIYQHQSRKLFKGNTIDLMLCDFGIHHLHLGVKEDSNHKRMVQGTADVVFVYVNDDEIFFIKVAGHGEWHLKNSLEIIHRERPDLIKHRIIRGIKGNSFKDEEILALRSKGYAYFIKIGTVCYMPEQIWAGKNLVKGLAYFIQLKLKIEQIIERQIKIVCSEQNLSNTDEVNVKIVDFDFSKFEDFHFELIVNNNMTSYKAQI
ncbi:MULTISPECIES: hypothetical protein [Acinetobacter]|uniref:Uncharacterized protein n=1 Tax=Acinetobacter kyonggiensis TaxID=595670 RepID=A0A1H3JAN8_9GAMM|nr:MULTISPECIES: hypothetical protein [Acinetobacter]OTG99787.1 hypothetical protein B9T30_06560 [Acinetobacter sp. ANC 4973]SDY36254.1 hypothetical protein SAMN05421643_108107 [Acinetobacter kyonggiensis]